MGYGFTARFEFDEAGIEALKRGKTDDDGREIIQRIDNILCRPGGNWERSFVARQSAWTPLSRKHAEFKAREGFAPETWKMTGRSFQALTTPVTVTVSGVAGNKFGRIVTIVENDSQRVIAEWRIQAPAAGGYFDRVHDGGGNMPQRLWLDLVGAEATAEIKAAIGEVFDTIMKRGGLSLSENG